MKLQKFQNCSLSDYETYFSWSDLMDFKCIWASLINILIFRLEKSNIRNENT